MASATVQLNVRIPPALADEMKARAATLEISLGAAVIEALEAYTQSNGPAAPLTEDSSRAATKGA